MSKIEDRGYSRPEVLVSTAWVDEHSRDQGIRIVESNEDPLLYASGHIPGAVNIDWTNDLNDKIRRDYIDKAAFEKLLSTNGIANDTTIVFYGDKNNWWACYSFWIFQLFGHTKAKVMDGGRIKWDLEKRQLTKEIPKYPATSYKAQPRDDSKIRAFRSQVQDFVTQKGQLVDVRSPEEYRGERLHMPNYPNEGALRGGHIPGAKNVPWAKAAKEDATFKDSAALRTIYFEEAKMDPKKDIIAYCRIGERSSLTWFVLTYLLGLPKVKNYDGSWTEWGNLVGVPVEKP